MSAEAACFVELALAGREGGRLGSESSREFDGHVPEPADPDDPHPVRRLHIHGQRVEHRNTSAQKRTRVGCGELLRDRYCPSPVRTHAAGEATLVADHGGDRLGAQIVISRHALATTHAAPRCPADAYPLTSSDSFGSRTDADDAPNDLVAQHRGIL